MMNKSGGYTWIQSCATIVCNAKNNDEQHIICVNYVISARENSNLIMDQCQLEIIKREVREPASVEKEIKSPARETKDDTSHETAKNFVKVESPVVEPKVVPGSSKKASPDVKPEEPATRGRKRKNKQESQDTKKLPLPPAASILSDNSCKDSDSVKERSESSVKDLENAMSKHLPSPSSNHATDFSTDSLLKHQDKESNAWNSSSASSYADQQSPVMPATSLLRQLYANRESVIRAARPSYAYPEGALPTPPGEYPNDSYPTNYATSYSTNPVEYNNNTMTPPSSVSPRDLSNLSSKAAAASYEYNHYPPPNESTVLQLPLKPQPYSIHPNYPPEGQYFAHHPGFWYPTPT